MKKIHGSLLPVLLVLASTFILTSCQAIGDIFSAGVYAGVFIVVFIIIIIIVVVSKLGKKE